MKTMSPRTAQLIAVAAAVAFIGVIAAIVITSTQAPRDTLALPAVDSEVSAQVQRDDSLAISDPVNAEVTIVEFLDFQCPACAVASGVVTDIKDEFGDRVEIIIRHYPLTDIHPNALSSALAFEAAAAQGATVGMYEALFASQEEWGRSSTSQAALFRGFADELGLDMAEYDRTIAAPETLARVARDRDDAVGLGLQGTPSFFIDGEPAALESFDDLRTLVAEKLN
jgi:protein-disulfide isomerase